MEVVFPLPYCVYVLISEKDRLLYTGYTCDLERRLSEHLNGNSNNTSKRLPMSLIFCEYYLFKEDALRREKYFKTSAGKKALKLMLFSTLLHKGYKSLEFEIATDGNLFD